MTAPRKVELVNFYGDIEIDKHGRVVVNFNRPLAGLIMDPEKALAFAKGIVETATEALRSGAVVLPR